MPDHLARQPDGPRVAGGAGDRPPAGLGRRRAAGRPGDAVEAALQVVNLAPDDPISEMLLGYCYDAAGDQANAQIARDRAKRLAQ